MLFDKLKADRIQAMKDKETVKKDLLSTLIGDASKETKEPADDKVIAVIKKFINNIELTRKALLEGAGGSQINAEVKLNTEKAILEAYLPKQMDRDALKIAVNLGINMGSKTQGELNKYLKEFYPGRYDGKLANEVIKEALNG